MARQAMLLVADEIFFNLTGKAILNGIYTGNLLIGPATGFVPQLVFFFMVETDLSDPFRSLQAEVTFPESAPITSTVPVTWPIPLSPVDRTKFSVRWPMLLQNLTLRPGKINAKLIHESGEIIVSAPWIVSNAPPAEQPKSN